MMFNLLKDQLIDDAVLRAEQSRVSYNSQTEEFRLLNADLQTYLTNIKFTDEENRQIQENIEDIRRKYILTLENHLQRLPNDFREQSQTLTNAHLERYRLKSRLRRCANEREEWKRRIQFLTNTDKEQTKYFTHLQKQDQLHRQEFQKLNEHYQRLTKSLANEKELHRQAMTKVDQLHLQLEQSWIDRSKTEFQIQSLKEEVQLMQTTKEFLSEERDTILSSRHDANEYFLSQLHESIARIRDDFEQINQNQLQQIEQDYQQMLQTLEENLSTNQVNPVTNPSQIEQLQKEQQTIYDEWTTMNEQNQTLVERVLTMENNLYSMRHERMQQLISKDQELEQSKMELQILNEKLLHLAEYDRNLKFELTLYRGVLESERRRKQVTNTSLPVIRPTTLRTNQSNLTTTTTTTDRRTRLTSGTKSNKSNDQQPEAILSTENRVSSDEDLLSTDANVRTDDVRTSRDPLNVEKLFSGESLWQQLMEPFSKLQQTTRTSTKASPQDEKKSSRSSSITANVERTPTSLVRTGSQTSPSSSTPPKQQLPSSHSRSSSIISPSNEKTSSINTVPFAFESLQPSSESPQQYSVTSEVQRSRNSSTTSTSAKEQTIAKSPSTPPQEHQPPSRTSSTSSKKASQQTRSPTSTTNPIISENQPSSRTSSISLKTSSDLETSPITVIEQQPPIIDVQQPSPHDEQPPSRTSSISDKTSSDHQKSQFFTATSTPSESQSTTHDVPQLSALSQTPVTVHYEQEETPPNMADDYQITTSIDNFDDPNPVNQSFIENDDNVQYEDSISYHTDEKALIGADHDEQRHSSPSIEQVSTADADILSTDKSTESRSSSFAPTGIIEDPITQVQREEAMDSSLIKPIEEAHPSENISSVNISTQLPAQDTSKQSSANTSLTDVEEIDLSTSPENQRISNEHDDSNLAIIMQDLRYVFHRLANMDEFVEINDELSDRILEHLECRDQFIQTLFNNLIDKYLLQPAIQGVRSNRLDWPEFRDVLFPLITGRYTERHIRKLFELFDTTQDGYLSLQEIAELLQVLHANDTIDLARTIIDEFDTDHDGKLNIDELLKAIKNHDDINDHALPEETENKEWFNQSASDNQTITLEVPIINFQSKINDRLVERITLLGKIFHRLGANLNTHQLDIRTENLVERMIEEFLHDRLQIPRDDLQIFIQSYIEQKKNNDFFIDWSEFRDLFLPIILPGCYSRQHLRRWFDLFDINRVHIITQEQATRIFRLLQLENLEHILHELDQITDDISSWTFDDLIYIIDENASHLLPDTNQIISFDHQWFSKTIS